jgi:hypothetical protein
MDIDVDLSAYAGRTIAVEILGAGPTFWHKAGINNH